MNVGTATGHFGVTTRITRVGFADGWTGLVAIGTIVYVLAAMIVSVADLPASPGLDFYRLVSDQPAAFAASSAVSLVAARPFLPVKALAFPELTTRARAVPALSAARHQSTGADGHFDFVKTPATVVPGWNSIRRTSVRPL